MSLLWQIHPPALGMQFVLLTVCGKYFCGLFVRTSPFMRQNTRSNVRFFIGLAAVLAVRLLPFRAPNVEPVLATLMPFAKRFGVSAAFVFGALSVLLFDVVTGTGGMWTLITAPVYGVIGIGAYFFFRNRPTRPANFLLYSVLATLAYDALTGLTIGPLLFGQSFVAALVGQIPFTILHLMGNMTLALAVSPAISVWLEARDRVETVSITKNILVEERVR